MTCTQCYVHETFWKCRRLSSCPTFTSDSIRDNRETSVWKKKIKKSSLFFTTYTRSQTLIVVTLALQVTKSVWLKLCRGRNFSDSSSGFHSRLFMCNHTLLSDIPVEKCMGLNVNKRTLECDQRRPIRLRGSESSMSARRNYTSFAIHINEDSSQTVRMHELAARTCPKIPFFVHFRSFLVCAEKYMDRTKLPSHQKKERWGTNYN